MMVDSNLEHLIRKSIMKLIDYCKKNNWAGFDPFDGLNSRVFAALPLVNTRIGRLLFIQAIKRSPVNLRYILGVPKEQNPKGLALFCSALLKLSNIKFTNDDKLVPELLNRLIQLRSPNKTYYCWGYHFDWQSRYLFLPKYEPNIICTSFVGNALIDAYEKYSVDEYLDMALSAGYFLLRGLNITRNENGICFSYTPFDHGQIHNANLLGAAFLSRIYSITNQKEFIDFAIQAVRFSTNKQNEDGSWYYGEQKSQKWIDNFHTGYNLVALRKFREYSKEEEFKDNIQKGFKFYKNNFITVNGLPKYFHNHLYPIDIHSLAQSIITLVEFEHMDPCSGDLVKQIFTWSIRHMQNGRGYFYYQKNRFYKNRIRYMRWSQAWMLYALAVLAGKIENSEYLN